MKLRITLALSAEDNVAKRTDGADWLKPAYGANGLYYAVVPAPL